MIISTMHQHHRVRVGLPNPRHRIWTDRPGGRHVGSFDGNERRIVQGPMFALESNPDLSFAQGTQCRETQRNRTHEPGSCKKRSGGVAPAGLFSLGDRATGGVSDSEHTLRRLGARSANRWGSYEINRSYVEAVWLLAHSCPGRVRRHVRSWRKPTPHSRRIRWSTD